jgi:hypothetical protein
MHIFFLAKEAVYLETTAMMSAAIVLHFQKGKSSWPQRKSYPKKPAGHFYGE